MPCAALVAISLVACHAAHTARDAVVPRCARDTPAAARGACVRSWTVLLYMTADAPDLFAPAERDLAAMSAAVPEDGVDVLVEVDRGGPSGVERLHVRRPAPASLEAFPEPSSTPEDRLRDFLTWGVTRYPAQRYAVVVWGHGLGYRPPSAGPAAAQRYDPAGTAGGLAFDWTRGTALDAAGLRRALADSARAGLGGRAFDIYASDACLMQSVEVAGELAGAARYVVGTEQIEEDYLGLPYARWLPLLGGEALPPAAGCGVADDACRAAAALPAGQRWVAEHGRPAPGFTLSALDATALADRLLPALRRLGAALDAYAREEPLRRIGLRVLLGAHHGPRGTPGFRGGTRDVGVFLARLTAEIERQPEDPRTPATEAVIAAARAAQGALRETVIAAVHGRRYQAPGFEGMAGVSVWLPHDEEEHAGRKGFFAPSVLDRERPSFRGFLDVVFAR